MTDKHMLTTEYIQLLNEFVDYLKQQEGIGADLSQILRYVDMLSEKSMAIGTYEPVQRLFNNAQILKNVSFYFPTANYEKRDEYKGHVLVISHEMGRSGAPIVLKDAVRVLKEDGYFVFVISPMDGPLTKEFMTEGVPVMIDNSLLNGRCEPDAIRSVNPYQNWITDLFVKCFDMTICNTAVLHSVVERYMHTGKPILWWMHEGNMSFASFGHYLPKKMPDNVHVAYVCDYVKEQAEAYGIHYPGTILHYGLEEWETDLSGKKRGNDAMDEASPSVLDVVKFMLVGAIDKRKGQDILLSAIMNLPQSYLEKCEFWFIGHPIDQDLYDRIEMLSHGMKQIRLWKSMPREQLLKLYEEGHGVICCSRDDPLPVVVTEAMILRKLCICSDHTGTASYLTDGQNGFICKTDDVADLCTKICEVIDCKDRYAEIGNAAYDVYNHNFTMEVFRHNLLELIGGII